MKSPSLSTQLTDCPLPSPASGATRARRAAAFDEEEDPFAVVIENVDGQFGHLGEGGLFAFFAFEIGSELHVRIFEEPEKVVGFVGVDLIECIQIVDEC